MKTVCKSGNVETIVKEVAATLNGSALVVYCADDKRFEQISKELHKAMPDAKMMGTTGFMFSSNGSVDEGLCAMGFGADEIEFYVGTIRRLDACPIKYVPGLIWSADTICKTYKNNVCLEFATGYEEKLVSTMKVSLEKVGIRLIGGTAGNTQEGQPKKVACNGKVLTNAAVYAVIGSKIGKIEVIKENMFQTRPEMHLATKVSEDGRTLYEINNRKAVDVYEEELGYNKATLEEGIFKHPFCRVVGDEHYMAAIKSFNGDKSITTYKNVQRSDMISFTDLIEDYRGFIEDNMNQISNNHNVAGIVSFNCILRYLYFEREHYTSEYAKLLNRVANGCHLGMVSDGEQYIEQHVNQSMVAIIFTNDK